MSLPAPIASPPLASRRSRRGLLAAVLALAGCQTSDPVLVDSTLAPTAAFAARSPADVAVMPVEDGTPDGAVARHLTFLRQEVMRQLPDRLFSPLTADLVDAALKSQPRAVDAKGNRESILAPAVLQKLAGHCSEDALFALRVDKWDESRLLLDRRVRFQFQAALVASDGQTLWSGTISGDIKAGGAGAAPRDKDNMARSCGELAVREMLSRLPRRVL